MSSTNIIVNNNNETLNCIVVNVHIINKLSTRMSEWIMYSNNNNYNLGKITKNLM